MPVPNPMPPPGPAQRSGVRLALDPAELDVEPGGVATAGLTVRNTGTRVEEFELAVLDPGAAFAAIEPRTVSVFPDDEHTAVLRFAPDRGPRHPAGPAPFQVQVRSRLHHDVADRAGGVVTVAPFDRLDATLTPEVTRGRRPGTHRVTLTNEGNRPATVAVGLRDRDGELSFDPPQFSGLLQPGESRLQRVQVGGRRRWFGRTETHPFTAVITPGGAPQPITLNGTRRQMAVFPWWIPTMALALVAVAVAVYALWPGDRVPPVVGDTLQEATDELVAAGYVVGDVNPISDESAAVNEVVRTEPGPNEPLPGGSAVDLFVSTGQCGGECVQVPDVIGLPIEEATAELEQDRLTVGRVVERPDPAPPGQVIDTFPVRGSRQAIGTEVTLTVSTGDGGGGITVPGVVGQSRTDAEQALAAAELRFEVVEVHTNDRTAGEVISSDPRSGEVVPPGTRVTLEVARPTLVDLLPLADEAEWSSAEGPFAFGLADGNVGTARIRSNALLEDETRATVLETRPDFTRPDFETPPAGSPGDPDGIVTGAFTLPEPIIAGDHLRARVGFLAGAGGKVIFLVRAGGQEAALAEVTDNDDGQLRTLDVDLSAFAGSTAVEIEVVAGDGSRGDEAVWVDLRVEGRAG